MTSRREFCALPGAGLALSTAVAAPRTPTLPLKFGHRQAKMVQQPGAAVFEVASQIPGLPGVELQVIWKGQDIGEPQTALSYKRLAHDWGVQVPSIAGLCQR